MSNEGNAAEAATASETNNVEETEEDETTLTILRCLKVKAELRIMMKPQFQQLPKNVMTNHKIHLMSLLQTYQILVAFWHQKISIWIPIWKLIW